MLSGRNCVAFVQVGREVVCSPDEIDTIVGLANARYSSQMHVIIVHVYVSTTLSLLPSLSSLPPSSAVIVCLNLITSIVPLSLVLDPWPCSMLSSALQSLSSFMMH